MEFGTGLPAFGGTSLSAGVALGAGAFGAAPFWTGEFCCVDGVFDSGKLEINSDVKASDGSALSIEGIELLELLSLDDVDTAVHIVAKI